MTQNFARLLLETGGEEPALVSGAEQWSHAELRLRVEGWAAGLQARGLRRGDRVLLLADNSPFAVRAYLATLLAGGVAVPISPSMSSEHLDRLLASVQPRCAFAGGRHVHRLAELAGQDRLEAVWIDGESPAPAPFRACVELDLGAPGEVDATPGNLAALMHTSGSTGEPRAVMVSHANLRANTEAILATLPIQSTDRALLALPTHYCFGASVLHTHLRAGSCVVLAQSFIFPERIVDLIVRRRCTALYGVPSTFQILLRRTSFASRALPDLRFLAQAGGHLSTVFVEELRSAFPAAQLYLMYGQTEATARLTCLPASELARRSGSIGRAIPGVELRLVDSAGAEVPPGMPGEIVASGASICGGYWGAEEETRRHFREGGVWTGDVAIRDEDGYLYLRDRLKDFVKVAGVRVSPRAIEDVISRMPEVLEAAVVGIPDPLLGEAIAAAVVPAPDTGLTPDAIVAHCRRALSNDHVPTRVRLVAALPKNDAGKVSKSQVAAFFPAESSDG